VLRRKGFTIYLLDEYKTSSLCLRLLNGKLEPFKWAKHDRYYSRKNRPCAKCHELLCRKNDKCLENAVKSVPGSPLPTRYYDRDTTVALNYRHIFKGFCSKENKTLERLSRKKPVEAADQPQPVKANSSASS
ncbi:hypothetical protein BX070DRAFT_184337, partial [Coemansia spiralis]